MGIIFLIIIGGIIWLLYNKGVSGCLKWVFIGFFGFLFLMFLLGSLVDKPSSTSESNYQVLTEEEKESILKSTYDISIEDEHLADPNDIYETKKFLRNLPEACKNSKAWVKRDGTVHIKLYCNGNGNYTNGYVEIKDGIVKEVK